MQGNDYSTPDPLSPALARPVAVKAALSEAALSEATLAQPLQAPSTRRLGPDRLVFFEFTGPFDREFFRALDKRRARQGNSPVGPYANIVTVRGSLDMTDDALEAYGQYVQSVRATATAHIIAGAVAARAPILAQITRFYADAGKSFGIFEGVPEAVRWACAQLDAALAGH